MNLSKLALTALLFVLVINQYVSADGNSEYIVVYNNNSWYLYTSDGTNITTAPIIQVSNLVIPLAGLEGKGTTKFVIFNVIYLPRGTVFNISAFTCSENKITNISVVIFKGNWPDPYNFSHRIKLNQRSSYSVFLPSGKYYVGIIFNVEDSNITELHFYNLSIDISFKKGTVLVLRPQNSNLVKSFFVTGRHIRDGKVKSISWIYYQTGKRSARIPILNLTNYKKTGKLWACFYTSTKNVTLNMTVHGKDLLSKHKLNWYPVEVYMWNGTKLDITNLKWNSTFLYNGSDYGIVFNPSDSWSFSRTLTYSGGTLRCIGVFVKWDPLLNASIVLSLPTNSLVGVTNNSRVQPNLEEIARQNRIAGIEVFFVGLYLLMIFLALRRPLVIGRCRFQEFVEDRIQTIRRFFQNVRNFVIISLIIVFLLAASVFCGVIPSNELVTWGGPVIFVLLYVLSVLLLLWADDSVLWVFTTGVIGVGILEGLVNTERSSLFVDFATLLLPFPFLVRSLRIAWGIIGTREEWRNRMQLFLSIVLSLFIAPGMIILVYAFASLAGLIDNSISTWQQLVGYSFMISLGTTILIIYECLLLREL